MRLPGVLAVFVLLAIPWAALACSSAGTTSSATPGVRTSLARPSGGPGALIIAGPDGLVEYRIDDGSTRPLLKPDTADTFLLDPALSPGGSRLAYIVQPPPAGGSVPDAGSDLWVAGRDGSGPRPLLQHFQANQLIRFPQWEDDDHILVIVQEFSGEGAAATASYTLNRVDAATGERAGVLSDVLAFGLSPDRGRLAYAKLSPGSGETLVSADLDGGNPVTLVDTTAELAPFSNPQYRPDGSKVAFASAQKAAARAPVALVSSRTLSPADAPTLDGPPEDIWTVDAGGGSPVRVADLKEDLPALTWSGDGAHLYVLGAAGLYDVNVDSGAITRIGDGVSQGQLTWAP